MDRVTRVSRTFSEEIPKRKAGRAQFDTGSQDRQGEDRQGEVEIFWPTIPRGRQRSPCHRSRCFWCSQRLELGGEMSL